MNELVAEIEMQHPSDNRRTEIRNDQAFAIRDPIEMMTISVPKSNQNGTATTRIVGNLKRREGDHDLAAVVDAVADADGIARRGSVLMTSPLMNTAIRRDLRSTLMNANQPLTTIMKMTSKSK